VTIQGQRQLAEMAKELWTIMLPNVTAPELYTFLRWANFDSEILSRAINRTAAKYRRMQSTPTPMSAEDCARYCSSVCRNVATGSYRTYSVGA
jgi:hypothetical protein